MGEQETRVENKQPTDILPRLLNELENSSALKDSDLTLHDLPEVLNIYKTFRGVKNRATVRETERAVPLMLRLQAVMREFNLRAEFFHQTGYPPTRDKILTKYKFVLEDWTRIAIGWLLDLGPEVLCEVCSIEDRAKIRELFNKVD